MAGDWNSLPHTIELLRIDLQRLANNAEAGTDPTVETLRSVLVNRIAALEAARAIVQSLTSAPTQHSMSLSLAALEALQEATEIMPRQKLD